jgi:hypothetical protein
LGIKECNRSSYRHDISAYDTDCFSIFKAVKVEYANGLGLMRFCSQSSELIYARALWHLLASSSKESRCSATAGEERANARTFSV